MRSLHGTRMGGVPMPVPPGDSRLLAVQVIVTACMPSETSMMRRCRTIVFLVKVFNRLLDFLHSSGPVAPRAANGRKRLDPAVAVVAELTRSTFSPATAVFLDLYSNIVYSLLVPGSHDRINFMYLIQEGSCIIETV